MSLHNIPGQPRVRRFLEQLIKKDHVPHALLFTGMAGTGKAAAALEFARALNCLEPRDRDACDTCASCRKMEGNLHPDLIHVSSQGTFIKLEQIRALRERVRFRPFEGKWRVVIIRDAHNLKEESANSLLKLLEEPPGQNLFMLLTLEPQMLLPTIISRCCHVRFQPLEDEWVERELIRTHGIEPSRAREVARLAGGSMERAAWWVESDRITRWEEILGRVWALRDMPMVDFFLLTDSWVKETKGTQDLEQDLECIKLWVRDVILARLTEETPDAFSRGDEAAMGGLLPDAPVMGLFHLYAQIEEALQHLRQNANKQLTLEGVCLAVKDILNGKGSWNSLPGGRQDLSF